MRRYAYGWITLIFFLVSMVGHWVFGWFAYLDEAKSHAEAPEVMAYLIEMAYVEASDIARSERARRGASGPDDAD